MLKQIIQNLKPYQHVLAVSKLQPLKKIEELYLEGQIHFGENYVQEALTKIENNKHPDIQWHLIGPLQKNKVKYLKNNFSYIHSVHSYELAKLISEKSLEIKNKQKIFLQINLSNEASKNGFSPIEFTEAFHDLLKLEGLDIVGLMTMPPLQNSAEDNRPYFKQLKKLADQYHLKELSMGTSHDYLIALEEGATWIRLGTILFGDRVK